uniref:Aminotransferase class I/classII domain-containing protein n=1 Tax=Plectus sambesii TaxID=2011161 RepID=A0A914VWZ5_9BILA
MLSTRARALIEANDLATQNYRAIFYNKWDPETNPQGNINFCTAINSLCEDLLNEKFAATENFWEPKKEQIFHYGVPGGYESCKGDLVNFINRLYNVSIKEENTTLAPGVTAAFDMLSFCLAEPDDVVLCPSPYYGRIFSNFGERGRVECVPVPFPDLANPKLEVEAFDKIFQQLKAQGKNVRAVIIINPNNPLGVVFSAAELVSIANWAHQHNLSVVMDECFASTVYKEKEKFTTVLSLKFTHPEHIIWLWGFSKNMCMPGLRFAAIHSENEDLMRCLKKLENLQPCSPLVQNVAAKIFADFEWYTNTFLPETLKRLQKHSDIVCAALTEMSIPFVPATAGFYVFCDFSQLLENKTFEDEEKVSKIFCNKGVYMTLGRYQACNQPGWMRLVFSGPTIALDEGLRRLREAIAEIRESQNKVIHF